MSRQWLSVLMLAVGLSGCSGASGVSTSSILASDPPPTPAGAAAAMGPQATMTDRALHVGSVTARASKCGYNFDPARIRAGYVAHEASLGGAQIGDIEKTFDVGHNGVLKAAAEDPNYCSERKTREIKDDLNKVLAGNYEPPRRAIAAAQKEDEGGLFDWFGSGGQESGPKFGSDGWWDKQREKVGQ